MHPLNCKKADIVTKVQEQHVVCSRNQASCLSGHPINVQLMCLPKLLVSTARCDHGMCNTATSETCGGVSLLGAAHFPKLCKLAALCKSLKPNSRPHRGPHFGGNGTRDGRGSSASGSNRNMRNVTSAFAAHLSFKKRTHPWRRRERWLMNGDCI